jgi:hypothetical protein
MYTVELDARVRRAVLVEGRRQRAVEPEYGLARMTVRKMLEYSLPPGYQRQQRVRRPKLGPWQGVIDAILTDDKTRPSKQRHTARRIFERLKDKHLCTVGYTIVKDYVRQSRVGACIPCAVPRAPDDDCRFASNQVVCMGEPVCPARSGQNSGDWPPFSSVCTIGSPLFSL